MKELVHIVNVKTNVIFESPNSNLIAYAKGDPSSFRMVYRETDEVPEPKKYSEDALKAMSVKDLQLLAEGLDCDKRRKDSLIDAILEAGR